ncbi:MAG: DUF4199 domain-containing protein [Bacteroidia bacterium]|nr:DUF4199 domain-containing protein [Bacteroidia bacterium]
MNKKALLYGLIYAAVVIAFKIYILVSGNALTKFGYFYSNITAVFLILPFYFLLLKNIRDKEYGGVLAGREAFRLCLSLLVVALVLVSIYHYIEFSRYGQTLAETYYNSETFLNFLKSQKNITPDKYNSIIAEQIKTAGTSAFKATTGKLVSYLFIGISGAFIVSVFMKRSGVKAR